MTQENNDSVLLNTSQLHAPGMGQPIDLALHSNQFCMVSGPSGCGKSQLLKALADLTGHQGEVFLQETNMFEMPADKWRAKVMYFAAETAWWLDTIAAHFEEQPKTGQLSELGLEKAILNANPDSLSSGEKQRLALLRGLQYQPKVLLLDEVTANLDEDSELLVEAVIKDYLRNHSASALWISHSSAQIKRLADTQIRLNAEGALS
jgi:ABC-type iron transport system FetAB ATPase subunit